MQRVVSLATHFLSRPNTINFGPQAFRARAPRRPDPIVLFFPSFHTPPPAAPEAAAPADSAAYVSQLIKDGKDVRLCRTEEERSMFWRQRYLAAQKKVIRRDASTSKGDEKRKRQADTIVQLESELDSQAEAAQELRDHDCVVAVAAAAAAHSTAVRGAQLPTVLPQNQGQHRGV